MAVLLAPLAFQAAVADDTSDVARAATRQGATGTITTTRQRGTQTQQKTSTTSRATNSNKSGSANSRERSTTTPRDGSVAARTTKTPEKTISARTATKIHPRTIKTVARTAQPRTTTTRTAQPRATTTLPRTRARTTTATTTTGTDVLNRNFSKCRTVFYDCMDEFCANKDAQLKRCACSSRIHEFDGTKQNLANVEEKLLDFSQRLLTVNMDKEDAAALYKPTEGELAYATKDTSASKKMLDEIAKKLNTSFNDNNFDQELNAISLSLNMDSAFDTVDSMAGASTTTKSGTDLYVSALPICREMASEVCTADDLSIAESSYQMMIESDCNTVKKSYQTQVDQAREQVFESGALLDMSRLDIHQKRNSDDILTCKSKMLDMLTDSTVCGADMGKCLDTTGRYIDPTTGSAFLTTELPNLATLITRPEAGQTWRTAPGNERFITFLKSKKKFLEPAMEHCQDISDYVWDEFIDDALAQIKLAQDAKLEEMRQSCTTLTTQCLDKTYDSITEFDARALSIFGVAADQTVNAMCADVQNACTALMQTSGGAENWQSGMTEIATDKTYDTILRTCREVGRACIIQACTSVSGNFGLCENIDTSINRKSILNRTTCWDQVVSCVASAGPNALANIQKQHPLDIISNPNAGISTTEIIDDTPEERPDTFRTFYGEMYGISEWGNITLATGKTTTTACISNNINPNCVHDICATECENVPTDAGSMVSDECYTCRLAERIWGNCEAPSKTNLTNYAPTAGQSYTYHNQIRTTDATGKSVDTLLAWFAKNTGTDQENDSCRDTSCRPGYVISKDGTCTLPQNLTSSNEACQQEEKFYVYDNFTNCCLNQTYAYAGNCCSSSTTTKVTQKTNDTYFGTNNFIATNGNTNDMVCNIPGGTTANLVVSYEDEGETYNIVCLGEISWTGASDTDEAYPNGKTVKCDGQLVRIDSNGHYEMPKDSNTQTYSYYYTQSGPCVYDGNEKKWKGCNNSNTECTEQNPTKWSISYGDICVATRV